VQWGPIYPKWDCKNWDIKLGDIWDNNTLADNQRPVTVGCGGTNENIEIRYMKLDPDDDSRFAVVIAQESGTLDGCWIYRCSMRSCIKSPKGATTLTTDPVLEDCVISTDNASIAFPACDITGQTATYSVANDPFDASMNLTGSPRTSLLGTDGAEIA
jgi:hypothetical protein